MRQFTLLTLLLLALSGLALAQDDADYPGDDVEGGEEGEEGGEEGEECEEAWDYVEFMKGSIKDKIESILQDTLFQPRSLLEETVTKTMESVLEVRDDILARTKSIRTQDGEVTICPEQNIKQEEFLTQIRMQVMSVLLSLIEKDAAEQGKLQDIGKQLLAIRTKVNTEITRMIMLREATGTVRARKDDCDCGILGEVFDSLEAVINDGEDSSEEDDGEDRPDVNAPGYVPGRIRRGNRNSRYKILFVGEEPRLSPPYHTESEESEESSEEESSEEGAEGKSGEASGNTIEQLTMVSMMVDGEMKTLYSQILAELDEEPRAKLFEDLQNLKKISTDTHEVLSKLSELDEEIDGDAIARTKRRDVRSIRNDVKRLLDLCKQSCPGQCDSCGAEKIDEVADKLKDYLVSLEDLEEEEAKDSIRSDLMGFLTSTNTEMTDLLKQKAEDGELDDCGNEQLEVIDKIKGPLWMMVNITIFGDASTMTEMITALEQALTEMRNQYCSPDETTEAEVKSEDNECDLNEINTARDWIADIDIVIAEDIFKTETDDGRRNAMLALIELKSTMDDRVRELFQDNLQCKEEVEQIKNIYAQKLTECLSEMMNPRFRFDLLDRADRVQCVKDLRILIEDRRGVLLMREIEARINARGDGAIEA